MSTGTVFKRDGSPYYWMRFSHDGKRYQESTEKKRKDSAETAMKERIEQVKNGYPGLFSQLIKAIGSQPETDREGIRKELADKLLKGTAYELSEKPTTRLMIEDAFEKYRNYPHEKNPSKTTMANYAAIWRLFVEWLEENHPEASYMDEITNITAMQYIVTS